MARIFYRFGIFLYKIVLHFAALFNKKAALWVNGRKAILEHISKELGDYSGETIWMHCASLGEFEQGRSVLEALRVRYPEQKIVLTFFSPSGYEVRKNTPLADWVFYLPLDTPRNAEIFIELIRPKRVLFVKYEFWYFYLSTLKKKEIPTSLISAIFRAKQPFFKWYGSFFREMLYSFEHIFVQDQNSALLLKDIDGLQFSINGDTRLDRVLSIKEKQQKVPHIDTFCRQYKILVVGSSWPADERLLLSSAQTLIAAGWRLIIAPHEITDLHIATLEKEWLSFAPIRYSNITALDEQALNSVLIIDNIGMLNKLYAYADAAYIGGGFGAGIHNTLEAAVYGIPVLFGPNNKKFKEAQDLKKIGVGTEVTLKTKVSEQLVLRVENSTSIQKNMQEYIKKNKGATEAVLAWLDSK